MRDMTAFNEISLRHDLHTIEPAEVILASEDAKTARPVFAGDHLVRHSGRHRCDIRFGDGGDGGFGKHESRLAGLGEQVR